MLTPIMSLHLATVAPAAVLGAYLHAAVKGHAFASSAGQDLHGTDDDYGAAFFIPAAVGPQVLGHFGAIHSAVVARAVFCAQRLHRSEKAQCDCTQRQHDRRLRRRYLSGRSIHL